MVYRLILSLSRDSASKLVRLYCLNMFMLVYVVGVVAVVSVVCVVGVVSVVGVV